MPFNPAGDDGSQKRRVRIIDIAQKCGLSISTVSIVLHNKPGIPAETRQRVLAAAEELGYPTQTRPTFKSLQTARQVGVVMKAMPLPDVFYSDVLAGIDQACNQHHLNLIFTSIPCDPHGFPTGVPPMVTRGDFDGLIIVGTVIDPAFGQVIDSLNVPIVLVDGYSEYGQYDSVVIHNEEGAYNAVQHLIGLGHRHIGIAGSRPGGYPGAVERRNGYLKALQDAGLKDTYFADSRLSAITAEEPVTKLLQECPQVTALFACTDEIAARVIEIAHRLGRRVPEDLSVIGFDDIDWAQRTHPPLSTVHVDRFSLGRLALMALMQRIANPGSANIHMFIHTTLVQRESVRPVRQ